VHFLYPLEIGLTKLKFGCRTPNIGASRRDLFTARAAHQFIESRLRLKYRGFGFRKARCRTPRILAKQ
jgi:hypothetical protein